MKKIEKMVVAFLCMFMVVGTLYTCDPAKVNTEMGNVNYLLQITETCLREESEEVTIEDCAVAIVEEV